MRLAALALVLVAGCSNNGYDPCPEVVSQGWRFAYCQDGEAAGVWAIFADESWREVEALDDVLGALGMEPVAPHLEGHVVALYDREPESGLAGYYMGHHHPDTWRIHLFIPPETPRQLASQTALAHELWHGYEKNILGASLWDVQHSPGHFVWDETASAVLGAAASDDGCALFESYWRD